MSATGHGGQREGAGRKSLVPGEPTVYVQVTMPETMRDDFFYHCLCHDTSMSAQVRAWIDAHVMTWAKAVEGMSEAPADAAAEYMAHSVSDDGHISEELRDWVAEGSWGGNETLEEVKADWKEHNERYVEIDADE